MNKKSKETIQEIIFDLLNLRFMVSNSIGVFNNQRPGTYRLIGEDSVQMLKQYTKQKRAEYLKEHQELLKLKETQTEKTIIIDNQLIKLNGLLNFEEQYKEINELEAYIKKIQVKKIISVKEFTEIYNISKTSQQNYRGRLYDPLPYHQKVEGGKITYVVDEVEKWLANQHK